MPDVCFYIEPSVFSVVDMSDRRYGRNCGDAYKNLLNLTGYLTQNPRQVEEMFRRMVFNVAAENKDDHPKNFAFICRHGKWTLAPAYDLTHCVSGYNGEHATSVNNHGNPTDEDMIAVGLDIRIPKQKCIDIIHEVRSVVKEMLSS